VGALARGNTGSRLHPRPDEIELLWGQGVEIVFPPMEAPKSHGAPKSMGEGVDTHGGKPLRMGATHRLLVNGTSLRSIDECLFSAQEENASAAPKECLIP
jgi:hypothetical protein